MRPRQRAIEPEVVSERPGGEEDCQDDDETEVTFRRFLFH
jgi:hypothetical protein